MPPYTARGVRRTRAAKITYDTPTMRRQCPVCNLSALFGGRVCDNCREQADIYLADFIQQRQMIDARIGMARDEYMAAMDALTPQERARYLAMDRLRSTPGFEARYKATARATDGLGRVVRAEMALAALEPDARLLEALEGKIAVLEEAIEMRRISEEARRLGWEVTSDGSE